MITRMNHYNVSGEYPKNFDIYLTEIISEKGSIIHPMDAKRIQKMNKTLTSGVDIFPDHSTLLDQKYP